MTHPSIPMTANVATPAAALDAFTSGLPVRLIADGLPEEFQQHWAGTHFFNPPRYLKLVEIIPGPKTSASVVETLSEFCDRRLGKGVVVAKDTPNFIANRIGTFSVLNALRLMNELDMADAQRGQRGTGSEEYAAIFSADERDFLRR